MKIPQYNDHIFCWNKTRGSIDASNLAYQNFTEVDYICNDDCDVKFIVVKDGKMLEFIHKEDVLCFLSADEYAYKLFVSSCGIFEIVVYNT